MNFSGCLSTALILGFLANCSLAQAPLQVDTPARKGLVLKKESLGNIRPVHALGDIYLAGQPSRQDFALLKQRGFKTIISLRHIRELPWDEASAVQRLGMKFVHIPFQGPAELDSEVFDKVRKALRDNQRGRTLFHCGSANRVGAVWYATRVLDDKLSTDAALAEAKTAGLRTPQYLEKAQEYVQAERAKIDAYQGHASSETAK